LYFILKHPRYPARTVATSHIRDGRRTGAKRFCDTRRGPAVGAFKQDLRPFYVPGVGFATAELVFQFSSFSLAQFNFGHGYTLLVSRIANFC
jgi:hypothetical protein